ncbi:MAG: AAA family ATPase [Proteobacteria bacterium]|uniref:AAA family ATPase n=1 Tax=Candidatus Avisuccinivibrio stercorigallinarum TaxID=2840704 RepID=A0A9D9DAF2_9GAMM|nr:AAA family ATPase [Candidatus Avisuccinivibrio stercorigallinarum]
MMNNNQEMTKQAAAMQQDLTNLSEELRSMDAGQGAAAQPQQPEAADLNKVIETGTSAVNGQTAAAGEPASNAEVPVSLDPVVPEMLQPEELSQKGWRLHRFEIFNWGPFNHNIWKLNLNGSNTLLIGANGSGKSTLADAITTLLVPQGKIVYNKAAGAKSKDRTLASYVIGHIRNKRAGVEVTLRKRNEYTVILGVFCSEKEHKYVTLAQFFSFKGEDVQPEVIYCCAPEDLNIKDDFTKFGRTTAELRKRLRKQHPDMLVCSDFKSYSAWYRQHLHVSSRAVEIFNHCISLKDVQDINSFVCRYMLDAADTKSEVDALIDHFNDLTESYNKVKTARAQIEELQPIEKNAKDLEVQKILLAEAQSGLDGAETYVNQRYSSILQRDLSNFKFELQKLEADQSKYQQRLEELQGDNARLLSRQSAAGGSQIEIFKDLIRVKEQSRAQCEQSRRRWGDLLAKAGQSEVNDEEAFIRQLDILRGKLPLLERDLKAQEDESFALRSQGEKIRDEMEQTKKELLNLQSRESNIPAAQTRIRSEIAEAIDVDDDVLPYIGELLQVKEKERRVWEGAAERVLHNFALTMLVPDDLYREVVSYVNSTNLRGRLVFYKSSDLGRDGRSTQLKPNSLVNKLEVKAGSPFHDGLYSMLLQRFNYACCTDEDEFRQSRDALMPSGLYKANHRNEKDDRSDIHDRRNYVLGWSNAEKKRLLSDEAERLQNEFMQLARKEMGYKQEQERLRGVQTAVNTILTDFHSYKELDATAIKADIEKVRADLNALLQSADLAAIQKELDENRQQINNAHQVLQDVAIKINSTQEKIVQFGEELALCDQRIEHFPLTAEVENYLKEKYEQISDPGFKLSSKARNKDAIVNKFKDKLAAACNKVQAQIGQLNENLIRGMSDFCHHYPAETKEMTAELDSLPEYLNFLNILRLDNLPKFEQQFKDKLNNSTISDMAHFSSFLELKRKEIGQRIDEINNSLKLIDYNPEHYIAIDKEATRDTDIIMFRQDLKNCLSDTILKAGDDLKEAERKFQNIEHLIERLKGRADYLSEDQNWRDKVTDVRRWFIYSAIELERGTDREIEFYSSANAKSGGQKEKLAYTILAAALSYQIMLQEKDSGGSEALRFLMVDEAFSSGSPDLARYALSLFKLLELQVMVITPMTKIGVIEPYVSQIGYAENNQATNISKLCNFSVEHYKELYEKPALAKEEAQKRAEAAAAAEVKEREEAEKREAEQARAEALALAEIKARQEAELQRRKEEAEAAEKMRLAAVVDETAGTLKPSEQTDAAEDAAAAAQSGAESEDSDDYFADKSPFANFDEEDEAEIFAADEGQAQPGGEAFPAQSAGTAHAAGADDSEGGEDDGEHTDPDLDPDVRAFRLAKKKREQRERENLKALSDLPLFSQLYASELAADADADADDDADAADADKADAAEHAADGKRSADDSSSGELNELDELFNAFDRDQKKGE